MDLIAGLMSADWAEVYLVESADGPIAYLQAYDGAGEPGQGWPDLPPGTWGIDTFIGPPEAAGRGHGPAYLRQFGDRLLARPGVERLSIDPARENRRAIRAYERAGFVKVRVMATPEGEAQLMIRECPGS